MPETVHEYYKEQPVLPTYGKFLDKDEMRAFERSRREMFTDKLFMPARLFENARMIEFGPDSGENSLVFAMWGANCTLIEPNPKAHPVITEYFQRYNLNQKLTKLEAIDILAYGKSGFPQGEFDLIDAEYSIYTVHPAQAWIEILSRLLKPDGLAIFLYMEAYGSFLELFMKVIHSRLRQQTGMNAVETSQVFLKEKWASIPHKRSLEAFVMDVLENPFTRLDYLMEPKSLCKMMYDVEMDLYSSWPPYKDGLRVEWVKKPLTPDEALRSQNEFIARSRLSHLLGQPCFLTHSDANFEKALWDLVLRTDRLIDTFDMNAAQKCQEHLHLVAKVLQSGSVIGTDESIKNATDLVSSLIQLIDLLIQGTPDPIVKFCNTDKAFIHNWGSPAHATVFRKRL